MSEARNDVPTTPVAGRHVAGGALALFSKKEWALLLAAAAVVIVGTAAAALSPALSAASGSDGSGAAASTPAHARPTTASAAATAAPLPAAPAPATVATSASTTGSVAATNTANHTTAPARVTTTITKTITKIVTQKAAPRVSLVSTGTIINFGTYGASPLRWRVLDVDDDGVLLLSQYVISAGAFRTEWEGKNASRYGSSEIRGWLKKDFIAAAFDSTQSAALLSHLGGITGGDRAFLLTAAEVKHYFPKAKRRRAAPGVSAAEGVIGLDGAPLRVKGAYSSWWLADAASDEFSSQLVKPNGKLGSQLVYYPDVGVRPAIRVDRDQIDFALDAGEGN